MQRTLRRAVLRNLVASFCMVMLALVCGCSFNGRTEKVISPGDLSKGKIHICDSNVTFSQPLAVETGKEVEFSNCAVVLDETISVEGKLTFTNCTIKRSGKLNSPAFDMKGGDIFFIGCRVTQKGNREGASALIAGDAKSIEVNFCTLNFSGNLGFVSGKCNTVILADTDLKLSKLTSQLMKIGGEKFVARNIASKSSFLCTANLLELSFDSICLADVDISSCVVDSLVESQSASLELSGCSFAGICANSKFIFTAKADTCSVHDCSLTNSNCGLISLLNNSKDFLKGKCTLSFKNNTVTHCKEASSIVEALYGVVDGRIEGCTFDYLRCRHAVVMLSMGKVSSVLSKNTFSNCRADSIVRGVFSEFEGNVFLSNWAHRFIEINTRGYESAQSCGNTFEDNESTMIFFNVYKEPEEVVKEPSPEIRKKNKVSALAVFAAFCVENKVSEVQFW